MRLPRLTYTTRAGTTDAGTTFDLSPSGGCVAWDDSLMGWEWTMDDTTGQGTRKARKVSLQAAFTSPSVARDFLALADRDARDGVEGTLTVGEGDGAWELACGVMSGECVGFSGRAVAYKLTLHATRPVWRRYRTHSLLPSTGTGDGVTTTGLDLPSDLGLDLAGTIHATGSRTFSIDSECSVCLRFYGPCSNPYAIISSDDGMGHVTTNTYGVNAAASYEGDRIVIDPLGRGSIGTSVYLVSSSGSTTNLYDARVRGAEGSGSYVFETMPAGTLTVSWPQSFGIDVITIEERGSLPWA